MFVFDTVIELFCTISSLLSTKESVEIGIFRFFNCFSKMWKIGEKYKAERIGERAKPCLTPISTLKKGEEKSFQRYLVFLPTR